jgi:hypothetical protein
MAKITVRGQFMTFLLLLKLCQVIILLQLVAHYGRDPYNMMRLLPILNLKRTRVVYGRPEQQRQKQPTNKTSTTTTRTTISNSSSSIKTT